MTATLEPTEVPRTLEEAPPPRLLGLWDQTALWGNLGVSLLLPVAAAFVIAPFGVPRLSLAAAMCAIFVGSIIGNLLLGLAAVPGADTGAPAMVLLRGLFGWRGSWLPTGLNLAQCLGWTTVEIVVISEAAMQLTSDGLRPLFVVLAGGLATLMAIRPLGIVRGYLKRYAVWAVLASTTYLFIQVLRQDLPPFGEGSWSGFWLATDIVISLGVSWIPLAADYSRHSRSRGAAFGGAFVGYASASMLFFSLGVLAISAATLADPDAPVDVIASLLALPAGGIAMLILVVDEIDEVFANLYSTVVSTQNLRPSLDRRIMAVAVGALATVLGLAFSDYHDYESFLLLIGSVFVPLFATFAVDYYVLRRGEWDTSERAQPRWEMVIPWLAGFVTYQLINPGIVSWWASWWTARRADIGLEPKTWMSASLLSLVVAAVVAYAVGSLSRRSARPPAAR